MEYKAMKLDVVGFGPYVVVEIGHCMRIVAYELQSMEQAESVAQSYR